MARLMGKKGKTDPNAGTDVTELVSAFNKVMEDGGYPTPEEIMSAKEGFTEKTLRTVEAWKMEVWYPVRDESDEHRFEAIKALLLRLAVDLEKPLRAVIWENEGKLKKGGSYAEGSITLYGAPSVITGMHELGHHLFGSGEPKACSWSVHLFRMTFPRAFEKLSWNGHMLVEYVPKKP